MNNIDQENKKKKVIPEVIDISNFDLYLRIKLLEEKVILLEKYINKINNRIVGDME